MVVARHEVVAVGVVVGLAFLDDRGVGGKNLERVNGRVVGGVAAQELDGVVDEHHTKTTRQGVFLGAVQHVGNVRPVEKPVVGAYGPAEKAGHVVRLVGALGPGLDVAVHKEAQVHLIDSVVSHVGNLIVQTDDVLKVLLIPGKGSLGHTHAQGAMVRIDLADQGQVVVHGAGEHLVAQLGKVLVDQAIAIVIAAIERIFVVLLVHVVVVAGVGHAPAGGMVVGGGPQNETALGFVDGIAQPAARSQFPFVLAGGNRRFPRDAPANPQTRAPKVFIARATGPLGRWCVAIGQVRRILGANQAVVGDVDLQFAHIQHVGTVQNMNAIGGQMVIAGVMGGRFGKGPLDRYQEGKSDGKGHKEMAAECPGQQTVLLSVLAMSGI